MSLTQAIAEFALSPANTDQQITPDDQTAAKVLLLDALGCALAGWRAEGCQPVVDQMRAWGGASEARVLFHGDAMPAPNAAFANGVMIHALDLDDVYIPGTLHLSSVVVPALLAAAEHSRASGGDTLRALIVGVEVAARIERLGRDHRRGQGFLPTSLAGSFGAVMAAARVGGLTAGQCVQAMGMNYAQLAGNRQALYDSTLSKRMQPAMAARSALWATALAQRGLTGPHLALEGEVGYYRLYLNMPEPPTAERLTVPADPWQIGRVAYKRFPSCGANHHMQIAAEKLQAQDDFDPADIQRVELFGMPAGGMVTRPFTIGPDPAVDAQFNAAWSVAHTLLRGPAQLADYQAQRIVADREVIELAQAIGYIDPPDDLPPMLPIPEGYHERNVRWQGVVVTTTDGRRLMQYHCPAQTFGPGNLTMDQCIDKFQQCAEASGICNDAQARRIVDGVQQLDQAPSLASLYDTLHFSLPNG